MVACCTKNIAGCMTQQLSELIMIGADFCVAAAGVAVALPRLLTGKVQRCIALLPSLVQRCQWQLALPLKDLVAACAETLELF